MRTAILILIMFHGLIHLMGFSKAFGLATVSQLSQSVTKVNGGIWFAATLLFIATAVVFFLRIDWWWMLAVAAILISQYLIFTSWQDAKFGTIANGLILLATVVGFGAWNFSKEYRNEIDEGLTTSTAITEEILTDVDIQHMPNPVKKYLHYTGSVGKPKVKNFKVAFSGQFRQNEQTEWMPFTSEQYNFMEAPVRLFFMKATMKHMPVVGFHCFKDGNAFMDIRLLSLFKVQYQAGKEMNVSETVTFFNDMCVMAPATLIDKRIKWVSVEGDTVKAEFTDNGTTISASLYFNEKGELVNFISEDRYAVTKNSEMVRAPWSTPLKEYKEINGYRLATYGETIYDFPEGDFCYGKFRLNGVRYNCK
ncbi:MAG: hypothetical protein C0490_17810 [Marivirga sp.]|nr:hypothetical protein [Marivirga sp.]